MEKTRPSKQLHPGKLKQHKYYACSSDKANDQDVRRTIINLKCNTICKFKFINICCYILPNPRNSWVVNNRENSERSQTRVYRLNI